jgi:aminoglycoside phosphotransferase (APT) family kinase protein
MFDPVAFVVEQGLTSDRTLRVDALTGGYLNQVFRLRGQSIDWVVKRFLPETELALFPNLPEAEHRAMALASKLHLAPKPIAFVERPDAPVLVYHFVEGEMWRDGVQDVARLLYRLRSADPSGFRAVPIMPEDILAEGDAFLPKLAPERRARLAALRPEPIAIEAVKPVLLHTDIGPGNIIVAKDTGAPVVIDWQCPAAGDPVQDVIAFLSPAFQILYSRPPLTARQEADFFMAYDDAALKAHYDVILPFYDWRMAGYCAMRIDKYAATRPEASQRYVQATAALLARLEIKI